MENTVNNNQINDFDLKSILKLGQKYWYLFVLLPVLCVIIAALVKVFTVPQYTTSSSILLKSDEANLAKQVLNLSSGFFDNYDGAIDDEITVIKSNRLFGVLADDMNLRTETYIKKNMLWWITYQDEPLLTVFPQDFLTNLKGTLTIYVSKNADKSFSFKFVLFENRVKTVSKYNVKALDEPIKTKWGDFVFVEQAKNLTEKNKDYRLKIVTYSFKGAVARLAREITVARNNKSSNIIVFSMMSSNPKRNESILNNFIDIYLNDKVLDQNKISRQMADFVTERVGLIFQELKDAEQRVEDYRKRHNIVDISTQSQNIIQRTSEYEKQIANVDVQLSLIGFIETYLKKTESTELLPPNTGIQDNAINGMIGAYNDLVLKYQKLSNTATAENPAVMSLQSQINTLKNNILQTIDNYKKSAEITKNDLKQKSSSSLSQMQGVPTIERELIDISRQQQIKEALFVFLLQKREEVQLSLAMATSSAKIVEPAYTHAVPQTMGFKKMALFALVIGLILAAGIVYLLQFLKDKVTSLEDLKQHTKLPILGSLPKIDKNVGYVAVTTGKHSILGEKFRMMRTNLSFVMQNKDSKVVLVTSYMPEEGKTFVSINLSLSLALTNKKVALLGLDVRKPCLAKYLNIKATPGITNFISDTEISVQDIGQKLDINENVSVFVGGTVPPNPSELLCSERLDLLIEELRKKFDFVIIDSAPVGLLTDTLVINRVTDAVILVAKAGITRYSDIKHLGELVEDKHLTNASILLNNEERQDDAAKYGRYGY